MNKLILIILLSGFPLLTFSQENNKTKKLKHFLELTGSVKLGEQVIDDMIGMFQSSYSDVGKEFWTDFRKEMKGEELINLVLPIYDKYYSEEEIDQLIAFYNTPIGKKTVAVLPQITQESMLAGQTWGMEIGEKVMKRLKEKGHLEDK